MSAAAPSLRTFDELYAEIRALPPNKVGMILDAGELTVMSRSNARHQRAMKGILRALAARDVDAGGVGWWILSEVEVRFPDGRLLVPDLLGYRTSTLAELPDENPLSVIPDWSCEILSPGTARDDRLKKLRIYAAHRVGWTWIVDPEARTIECFESVDGLPRQSMVASAGETIALPPFDLPLVIDELWGRTT